MGREADQYDEYYGVSERANYRGEGYAMDTSRFIKQ